MGLDETYRKSAEFVASYDFEDVASGLGFKNYWGTTTVDTAGTNYDLLSFQMDSGAGVTASVQVGTGTTTINFDTSVFNLPRTAKGTAYINLGPGQSIANAVSIKAQIAIVDSGGTPTNISSEFETPQNAVTASIIRQSLALPLTQTIIKKGEKLRMIMKIVVDATGGNGTLWHDNTESDTDKSLKLFMPFKVEQ